MTNFANAKRRMRLPCSAAAMAALTVIALSLLLKQTQETAIGWTLAVTAFASSFHLWIHEFVKSPPKALVITTHLLTNGQQTEWMADQVGFPLDSYSLATPGFDGKAADLLSDDGRISEQALFAAQVYFRHVMPQVLKSPDKRTLITVEQLAAIHPELKKFADGGRTGSSFICHAIGDIQAYDLRWHSDSHLFGVDRKYLMIYGTRHVRVTPFENSLAWLDHGPRHWMDFDGEPHYGVFEEGSIEERSYREGDMFSVKAVNLQQVVSQVNEDGMTLMLACSTKQISAHPYGWLPAFWIRGLAGTEAREALRLKLFDVAGYGHCGTGEALEARQITASNNSNSDEQHGTTEMVVDKARLDRIINKAKEILWADMDERDHTWNKPPQMGPGFDVFSYFVVQSLGLEGESKFDVNAFSESVIASQLPDGSWHQVPTGDPLLAGGSGDLDTTIFVYWFLKTKNCGGRHDDDNNEMCATILKRAREFVLEHGGLDASQTTTKLKLATFGHYPWDKAKRLPLFPLQTRTRFQKLVNSLTIGTTAQWIPQHLVPLTYLRHRQVVLQSRGKPISELLLNSVPSELMLRGPSEELLLNAKDDANSSITEVDLAVLEDLVEQMLSFQEPQGSMGAYTVATELSLIALADYAALVPGSRERFPEMGKALRKGFEYLENAHFAPTGNDEPLYRGRVMDGRWWDTIVAGWALSETAEPEDSVSLLLEPTMEALNEEALQPNGGVSYGRDFEYAPDTDDTSLYLLMSHNLRGSSSTTTNRSVAWLESMQNSDGGFPAFHKDRTPWWILQKAFEFTGVADSAELFDVSCADLTGHVLDALGTASHATVEHPAVSKAIDYLKRTQRPSGAWQGRWGVNYVYGVGAVLPGLRSVGVDLHEPWVQNAIRWLIEHQNADGGFGESLKSYESEYWAGVGVSTVSQTAWGLLALLEAPLDIHGVAEAIDRAVLFLMDSFDENNERFVDVSVVGTGHRGIVNLQYPIYADTFPLVALSRYRRGQVA